jgi:hypothetical protein
LPQKERRQPVCVYCGHTLDRVSQTQYEHITWAWSVERGAYLQDAICSSDRPYHDCSTCPDGCDAGDADFADNDLIYY